MMGALWSAKTGMNAQQFQMDTISNNLSNVDTNGFKAVRNDFEDLLYTNRKYAGAPVAGGTNTPTGIYVGHGTKVADTYRIFTEGNLQKTQGPLDMAITSDGFFEVQLPDGRTGYTRDGSFKKTGTGLLVNAEGYQLIPAITIPQDATSITITPDGIVSAQMQDGTVQQLGQITLARFVNPAGLEAKGNNIYVATPASGDPIEGVPGQQGFGSIYQGYLEKSNVDIVNEMVNMILAQRIYDFNSKTIQSSDEMLRTAGTLKR